MKLKFARAAFLSLALTAVLLAGCADQMEPAKKAISDIEAAVAAAGHEAVRYIPDDVKVVKDQIADLKKKFDKKDYKGVIDAAPAVLARAQALAPAAAAKKAEAQAGLQGRWNELSTSVPAVLAALESRLAEASTMPGSVDAATLELAKQAAANGKSLWAKANEEQAAGRLDGAVGIGTYVKDRADAALAKLGAPGG